MNVQGRRCDPARIEAFLDGRFSDFEQTALDEHLSECVACRESLRAQTADEDFWDKASRYLCDDDGEPSPSFRPSHFASERGISPTIEAVLDALQPTDDPEMLGRLGGHEVSGVVGAGAMGVVLKGYDKSLDRTVAIKVMAPHLASHGAARKRFAREAKAAAAVLHPNVIAIHSVSNDRSLPYLVMPYVGGDSLQKRLDAEAPLPTADILRIGAQIAAGLHAAHVQGLVHRDIKPANVLLENGVERVAITDFGLARAVDDATMTRSGVIAGTPQYMSPEQARGEAIDTRSDLFSLGSVLYTMCTGRAPFRAETSYGILRRITDTEPRPIREVNPDVPQWLCGIIARLLAKHPGDRFESANEVATLLGAWLAHLQQPDVIPPPERIDQATAPAGGDKRSRLLKYLMGAGFACFLFLAGIVIVLELNKGTLTIKSEVDNVPIKISQGDKIVEKLTVTKAGASIRIAAGSYLAEVDLLPSDGIFIQNGAISLQRGDNEIVRITQRATSLDLSGDAIVPTRSASITEVISKTNVPNLRRGEDLHPDFESLIKVDLTGDKGIEWLFNEAQSKREPLGYPFCVDNVSGPSLFPLIDGSGHKIETSTRMQCANASESFWKRIQGLKVELHVTREDFDQVLAGNSIVKVVFLPDDESRPTALATLSSSRLDPGIDALAEADRRGQPVVSMELRPRRDSPVAFSREGEKVLEEEKIPGTAAPFKPDDRPDANDENAPKPTHATLIHPTTPLPNVPTKTD